MMTTTVHALLPPPDDDGKWVRLAAAHSADGASEDLIDEAEEYFEEVGWPGPDGTRQVPVELPAPAHDPQAAAESYTVRLADLPEGTQALVFSSSW